ncbi:hypothetical protein Tco_0506766 [Tanacetum coccineum]
MHAEGSLKEFPRTQGSKTQDVTKRNEVVTTKSVGVGIGVACYGRGLKEGGGGGMVMVKEDMILGITVTGML